MSLSIGRSIDRPPDPPPSIQILEAANRRARIRAYVFGAIVLISMVSWSLAEPMFGRSGQMLGDLLMPFGIVGIAVVIVRASRMANVRLEQVKRVIAEEEGRLDALSGLYNLRSLRECLSAEIAEAARQGDARFALISLDLDNFKEINDRFGHLMGDEVITMVGAAIRGELTDGEVGARPGGDEFAVLLPRADRARADEVARGVVRAIERGAASPAGLNWRTRVSTSYGIAVFPEDGCAPEALTSAADRALYRAKQELAYGQARSAERNSQDVFFALGEAMSQSLDPLETVHNFGEAIARSLGIEMCGLWRGQDDGVLSQITEHITGGPLADVSSQMTTMPPITVAELEESGLMKPYPVYLEDASVSDVMPERFRRLMPAHTWFIAAPVLTVAGGLLVMSADHTRSAPPAMSLVLAIARLAGSTLGNADAYQRAQTRGEQLAGLAGVGGLLFGDGEYEDRLGAVAKRIVEVTGYPTVTLDTLDPAGERSFCRNVYGRQADGAELDVRAAGMWRSMRPALREPATVDFLKKANKPIMMNDPMTQAPPGYRALIERAGVRTVAVVPVLWQGEMLGMLYCASYRPNAFSDDDIALMQSIASQLAPAIRVVALHLALETSYRDLKDAHLQALLRLAYAAEARDPYTECHLQRIRAHALAIASRMGVEGEDLEALGYGAVVHDLGKLRIPDSILTNPGTLSDDEWVQMKRHPEWGAEIIGANPFYDVARQVALCHHERWDGSGYPNGLEGEQIPLAARVVAVADVYDALTSARPYKGAWPPERALVELMRLRGKTLCPRSVDTFMDLWREGEIGRIDDATRDDSIDLDFRTFRAA